MESITLEYEPDGRRRRLACVGGFLCDRKRGIKEYRMLAARRRLLKCSGGRGGRLQPIRLQKEGDPIIILRAGEGGKRIKENTRPAKRPRNPPPSETQAKKRNKLSLKKRRKKREWGGISLLPRTASSRSRNTGGPRKGESFRKRRKAQPRHRAFPYGRDLRANCHLGGKKGGRARTLHREGKEKKRVKASATFDVAKAIRLRSEEDRDEKRAKSLRKEPKTL